MGGYVTDMASVGWAGLVLSIYKLKDAYLRVTYYGRSVDDML
jgi:hypothetical protein